LTTIFSWLFPRSLLTENVVLCRKKVIIKFLSHNIMCNNFDENHVLYQILKCRPRRVPMLPVCRLLCQTVFHQQTNSKTFCCSNAILGSDSILNSIRYRAWRYSVVTPPVGQRDMYKSGRSHHVVTTIVRVFRKFFRRDKM